MANRHTGIENTAGYKQKFHIDAEVSNNAFSFQKRLNRRLIVPALKERPLENIRCGRETVFEDFDENGRLKSCSGLENFIKTSIAGVPLYVVDNHNHVFWFWAQRFWEQSGINEADESPPILIHIDQHKDSRIPQEYLSPKDARDPQKVFVYVNTVLNVGNFIPAALHAGIISSVINVTSRAEMEKFALPEENFILDVDMDFFAPEMNYIGEEEKLALIKSLLPEACLITVATSPFFIDQKKAINYLLKIFS